MESTLWCVLNESWLLEAFSRTRWERDMDCRIQFSSSLQQPETKSNKTLRKRLGNLQAAARSTPRNCQRGQTFLTTYWHSLSSAKHVYWVTCTDAFLSFGERTSTVSKKWEPQAWADSFLPVSKTLFPWLLLRLSPILTAWEHIFQWYFVQIQKKICFGHYFGVV